jgi:hypothetical protein
LRGFCRNTNLSILHSYFSGKNYSSKVYTPLEKVVVLGIQSTEKLSLLFLDFSMIFNRFYKFQLKHIKGENLFTPSPLEVFKSSQPYPRFPSPEPGGEGELAGGKVEHGVANKRRGSAIGLTTECLAVVARPEGSPASGGGAGATGPRRLEVRRGKGLS